MKHELLVSILSPLARFCIRRGVKLQAIVAALKSAMLEAAESILAEAGEPVTDSRLSAMTGVHRKDVRVRGESSQVSLVAHPTVRTISMWQTNKRFVTERGRPRILTIQGPESQFMELVRFVGGDLNPYTLLFELERTGAVERTATGIRLVSRSFTDIADPAPLVAEHVSDFIGCIEHNYATDVQSKNLQLKTVYDNIPLQYRDQIVAWIRKSGSEFHANVRSYLSRFDRDGWSEPLPDEGGTCTISCSSFSVTHKSEENTHVP